MSVLSDNQNLVPIPVIATFNSDGKIVPLYFSIEGIRLRVDHILCRQVLPNGITFVCEITNHDIVQKVTLFFHRSDCIWTLKKD